VKKYHGEKANEVFDLLSKYFAVAYDETGKIGKRYRRQDAIGTPFCITVDEESKTDNTITVRDRDTMEQIRLTLDEVIPYIQEKVFY
jgi:glycyl-tRNA synthetase